MEKSVHAIVPKGNMGYDQYTVPDTVAVEPTFATFLQHYSKHMSMASRVIILISVKRREPKTTHNTFRDCRVNFFRQPFSK